MYITPSMSTAVDNFDRNLRCLGHDACGAASRYAAPVDPSQAPAARLADLLRERTRSLHVRAEKSGIFHALLRGHGSRSGYALLLRNLLPVYEELEAGLESHRADPALTAVADPAVYRAPALLSDLDGLCGASWRGRLPLLPAARGYARRVAEARAGRGIRLLAHAYTRYLGDLNGGRVLRCRLQRSLGLGSGALAFYAYPGIDDLDSFKCRYRSAFDAAPVDDRDEIGAEACAAFQLNIALSEAVQRAATQGSAGGSSECAP